MKKKIIIGVILVIVLIVGCVGCGNSNTAPETIPVTNESTAADTAIETESSASFFQEIIVVDNENYTFKIVDCYNDELWGYTLKCYLENKTETELMFSFDNVSVNGFMCDPFWASSVAAGKKAYSEIQWSDTQLEENNITAIEEIEYTLRISDNEDWTKAPFLEEIFTIQCQ